MIRVGLSEVWPALAIDTEPDAEAFDAPDELVDALLTARGAEYDAELALCKWVAENAPLPKAREHAVRVMRG